MYFLEKDWADGTIKKKKEKKNTGQKKVISRYVSVLS